MSDSEEPDWLAELARGGEVLRRQIEPIAQAAEQFVRDARQAKAGGGPALPWAQRVALAVDAGMRELLPAPRQQVAHQAAAALTVNVSFSATAKVAAAGGLALSPMVIISDGDVVTASESASVRVVDSPRGLAALSDGQILALVLVWLFAFILPQVQAALTQEAQQLVGNYYATLAVALAVTWRIRDKSE